MNLPVRPTVVRRIWGALANAVGVGLAFAAAAIFGLGLLVLLFLFGVADGIDILFYRGLVLCGVAFIATVLLFAFAARFTGKLRWRDALAAGLLSLGLNVSFLVVVPVTVDRSISVFILSYMAAHPQQTFTAKQIETAFERDYLGRMRQIERRLHEQQVSGNIRPANGGYTISPQGMGFISWARWIGWLFHTDRRLLNPVPAAAPTVDQRDSK